MRFRHGLIVSLLTLALTACASAPEPDGPRIETVEDLVAALATAGMEVHETETVALVPDLPLGRLFYLGQERVEVYEVESEAAQRRGVQALLRRLPPGERPHLWGRGRVILIYDGSDGPTVALVSGLMGDSASLAAAPEDPYPPAVVAAIGWVSEESGVDASEVTVTDFEATDWPDACLGLADANESCAAVVTPGWRVTLRVGDATVVVRTDELGSQIRRDR